MSHHSKQALQATIEEAEDNLRVVIAPMVAKVCSNVHDAKEITAMLAATYNDALLEELGIEKPLKKDLGPRRDNRL